MFSHLLKNFVKIFAMYLQPSNFSTPVGQSFKNVTLTIPNLAPSLQSIINASLAGDGIPFTHQPLFDDDDISGTARLMASQSSYDEAFFESQKKPIEKSEKVISKVEEVQTTDTEQVTPEVSR